ncbi:MAG TPA: TetR/AcrR family transcriptional regulator [Kofleriaceae bacterium]|nr:TetR/AcrR family transcriptional regulator [Kofleriaceae bacterium]
MARTSNTADRRAQIVDALIAVMAKQGYDGASIADVARKAGLASGLVHYHFESKHEILLEAVRVLAANHERALDSALATCRDPVAELAAFIDVHLGLGAHADPAALACWVLVMAEAIRDKRVRGEVETVLARQAGRVAEILRRGNDAKQFACEDLEAAAAAIVATIQGYFSVAATARSVIPAGSAAGSAARMIAALVGARPPLAHKRGSR